MKLNDRHAHGESKRNHYESGGLEEEQVKHKQTSYDGKRSENQATMSEKKHTVQRQMCEWGQVPHGQIRSSRFDHHTVIQPY